MMEMPTHALLQDRALDSVELLYGNDPLPAIVAVEPVGAEVVRVYRRAGNTISSEDAPFGPWLLAAVPDPWQSLRSKPIVEPLKGNHSLRYLVEFPTWPALLDAVQQVDQTGAVFFRL